MKDLENQKTVNQLNVSIGNENSLLAQQGSLIDESPAIVALEAKLLRRRKKTAPVTYRRPAYLQYIDYV